MIKALLSVHGHRHDTRSKMHRALSQCFSTFRTFSSFLKVAGLIISDTTVVVCMERGIKSLYQRMTVACALMFEENVVATVHGAFLIDNYEA